MLLRTLFASVLLLAAPIAHSQTVSDYAALMQLYSRAESNLLDQRSALLAREQSLTNPIWLRDSSGAYHVVSADRYRPKIEAFVSMAQLLDLDDAALQQLPLASQMAASLLSEELIASTATAKILQALQTQSTAIRSGALQGLEAAIEKAQSEFAAARQARDQLLAGDPNAPRFNTEICAQPVPDDATVYAWTAGGPSTFYWDAGSVLCDTYYYRVVVNTGDKLVLYKCADIGRSDCERQRAIYQFTERDGDVLWGRTFLSEEDLRTDAASGAFSWRQCRPAISNLPAC